MRIVLFTGKGGVGKTTTAAASAVRAARAGISTLVMSTDAAHSLGDALGRDLDGSSRSPARIEPQLHATQVNAAHSLDPSWRTVEDYLLRVLAAVGVEPAVAEELASLPGAGEIAALLELRAHAQSGRWDLVVVDCAPTGETLRLLALPEALAWHLERLLPAQRSLLRALRPAAAAAAGMPLPDPAVAAALAGWYRQMRDVQTLLTSERCSIRLVLTPERVVIAESRRAWTSLSLHGLVVDEVVVNRVLPDATQDRTGHGRPDPWLSAWNQAQRCGLREICDSFAGLPVVTAPYLPGEPVGADALLAFAQARSDGGDDPRALLGPVRRRGMTVRRTGRGYLLTLALPLVNAQEVDLKRRDTELLVVAGGHRRVLSLPSVLRRCVVTSAAVRDGTLEVRFVPDAALWPAGLAGRAPAGMAASTGEGIG